MLLTPDSGPYSLTCNRWDQIPLQMYPKGPNTHTRRNLGFHIWNREHGLGKVLLIRVLGLPGADNISHFTQGLNMCCMPHACSSCSIYLSHVFATPSSTRASNCQNLSQNPKCQKPKTLGPSVQSRYFGAVVWVPN